MNLDGLRDGTVILEGRFGDPPWVSYRNCRWSPLLAAFFVGAAIGAAAAALI